MTRRSRFKAELFSVFIIFLEKITESFKRLDCFTIIISEFALDIPLLENSLHIPYRLKLISYW